MRAAFRHRPGTTYWGRAMPLTVAAVVTPTAFEVLAAKLGLVTYQEQRNSLELRAFAKRYFRTKYVPEDLLKVWGLSAGIDEWDV